MGRWKTALLLFMLLMITGWSAAADDNALVLQYAPVIYQYDREQSLMKRDEIFTVVNFDGDWRTNNNAGNLMYYSLVPAMYYSLVESDTHYYIGYYLYYPRYSGKNTRDHDMVGIMESIRKTGDGLGDLDMLLSYNKGKWRKWDLDKLNIAKGHPQITVEDGIHKLLPFKSAHSPTGMSAMYPLPVKEFCFATSTSVNATRDCNYQLVNLQELWQRRNDIGPGRTFCRWGHFDSYYNNDVTAPWVWEYQRISWLLKPAEVIQSFQEVPIVLGKYLRNPYS